MTIRHFWQSCASFLVALSLFSCTEKEEKFDDGPSKPSKTELGVVPFAQNDKVVPNPKSAARLRLTVSGAQKLVTVKVQSPSALICGEPHKSTTSGKITVIRGCKAIVYNMTARTPAATAQVTVLILPGSYPEGLELTLCDSNHRVMRTHLDVTSLSEGETRDINVSYVPDNTIAYYQGFDACVWGGRRVEGDAMQGFAPTAEAPGSTPDPSLTGYEAATASVPYTQAGTGFIQPNSWDVVGAAGATVGNLHEMSDSYVKSRGFGDCLALFRAQEFQSCVGFGLEGTSRGIFRCAPFAQDDSWGEYDFSFAFMAPEEFTDNLEIVVYDGGWLTSVTLDGATLPFTDGNPIYKGSCCYIVPQAQLGGYTNKGRWRHFTLRISHATSATTIRIQPTTVSLAGHGFFLDEITVRKVAGSTKPEGSFRLLYWNIQNGMWADQSSNYDNFVAFVKRYDPDVCVWCEASTIYYFNKDGTSAPSMEKSKRYLPNNWNELAKRYGHSYDALGGWRDNYPQAITSKYPITTVRAFQGPSSKPIQHGAGLFKITIGGKDVYFVTLHTWPQQFKPGASNEDESSRLHEGSEYRRYEIGWILSETVNSASYSGIKNWLMMGDFNSRSRLDNWYYQYSGDQEHVFWPYDEMKESSTLVDVIGARYPGWFFTSTYGTARIDFVYASPEMYATVEDALIVTDAWTKPNRPTDWVFHNPSDHRPILVDFKL